MAQITEAGEFVFDYATTESNQAYYERLSGDMDAMVADFGLSAVTTEGTAQETYFKGALKYMAPESLVRRG